LQAHLARSRIRHLGNQALELGRKIGVDLGKERQWQRGDTVVGLHFL
jgi:hypothetical protein